ncbi:MAG: MerR family transcriptional regulator [Firmicutes bacterium]|nr:MerR family transcriptional regulator [Bacillota bacterium]
MKAKDLKNMGIDKERIKYYRREGVFTTEIPIVGNRANYTEKDVMALKQLTIFTKCGLSCGDIKRIQKGETTLSEAIVSRFFRKFNFSHRISGS